MKKHLTAQSVEKIRPPKAGQHRDFRSGLSRSCAPHRARWCQDLRACSTGYNGKLRRDTLGRWPSISLADAREACGAQTREAIAKGEAPSRTTALKAPALLFEVVVEEWLKRDQSKNKASSLISSHAGRVEADMLPAWRGRRAFDEITKRDVRRLARQDRRPWRPGYGAAGAGIRQSLLCLVHRARHSQGLTPLRGWHEFVTGKSRDHVLSDS